MTGILERTRRRVTAARNPPPDDLLAVMAETARARAASEADRVILPPHPVLQRLCCDAAEVTGTPWGVLSVLTARQQVIKATWGTDGLLGAGERMPLSFSLCAYVVGDDAGLALPDTAAEPAVAACLSLGAVGCYAGAPIRSRGVPIGALAGFGPEPQEFRAGHQEQLARLADEATALIATVTAAAAA